MLNEIPRAEIDGAATRFVNAYDIVNKLRPTMLVSRDIAGRRPPSRSLEASYGIKVYLDGVQYGGVESLASISAATVMEVRRLSAIDATTRYGSGHTAGAIEITTRTGRR